MAEKFCVNCGNTLHPGDKFCPKCGKKCSVDSESTTDIYFNEIEAALSNSNLNTASEESSDPDATRFIPYEEVQNSLGSSSRGGSFSQKSNSVVCPVCGTVNSNEYIYCIKCGETLGVPKAKSQVHTQKPAKAASPVRHSNPEGRKPKPPIAGEPPRKSVPKSSQGEPKKPAPKKKKKSILPIVLGIIIVVLLLLIGIAVMIIKPWDKGSSEASHTTVDVVRTDNEEDKENTSDKEENKNNSETTENEPEEPEEDEPEGNSPPSFSSVSASSSLPGDATTSYYGPNNVTDNNLSTAWNEGASGNGPGEYLTFTASSPQKISGVGIVGGYPKSDEVYFNNARPKEITLTFDDGTSINYTLKDSNGEYQEFKLDSPVSSTKVTITIKSVYPGSKYDDCCIAEVAFY